MLVVKMRAYLALLFLAALGSCNVIKLEDDQALVISTISPPSSAESGEVKNPAEPVPPISAEDVDSAVSGPAPPALPTVPLKPNIYSFRIQSDIKYRYSRTYVTSRVVNPDPAQSQEVTFKVVLPETAFISKFIMEIDGTAYEAYVREKEEAKRVYVQAQSQGQSAGLVELNTRNANVFNVNVNIKAQSKVNFNLTYEELLSRRLGRYEQSISITPDQITNVKDFEIVVSIEESQNITLLRVPNLRNDVEAQADDEGNNKDAVIVRGAPNKANITWRPSQKDQSQLGKQGITGKFVVQYDIKRELDAGEVLVMNGYFVHFFAPENLKPLRKHVVFVLDTSGSMWGRRMEQLKEAMSKILADLSTEDYFNILTFSSDVVLWSPLEKVSQSPNSNWSPPPFHGERVVSPLDDPRRRQPYPASKENIEKAQQFITSLVASGGTNIHDSIVQALNLTAAIKKARDVAAGVLIEGSTTAAISNETSTTAGISIETSTTAAASIDSSTAPTAIPVSTTTVESTTAAVTGVPDTTTVASPTTAAPIGTVNILPQNVESLVMFLTDGEPTVGITAPASILTLIQAANKNISVPLFSLAFGDGADFPFVRKLSLQNNGFARKIYEASDASVQLTGFWNEIASPLLSNVTFNYTTPESAYSVENITIAKFATIFGGTEVAVAGRLVPKPAGQFGVTTEREPEATAEEELQSAASGNAVMPTKQRYFDVYIGGFGREGATYFQHPEVFSSPIPWGIPIRPFPPRPTPAPTQEDLFLERLWAYLTIRQLIEKDLAEEAKDNELEEPYVSSTTTSTTVAPEVTTSSQVNVNGTSTAASVVANITAKPETPKQRALRLALKYGFVTSLTSLVVVKPNSSDVTNAEAADAKPDVADSMAAPQSISYSGVPMNKIAFTSLNRISGSNHAILPLSLSNHAHSQGPPGFGHGGFPSYAHAPPAFPAGIHTSYATTTRPYFTTILTTPPSFKPSRPFVAYPTVTPSLRPVQEPQIEEEEDIQAGGQAPPSTPTPELELTTTEAVVGSTGVPETKNLTLSDLTWFKEGTILIERNGTESNYTIAVSDDDSAAGGDCTVGTSGVQGQCVHLKDCVQTPFLHDFKLYSESYFCKIDAASVTYAGACCTQRQSS